MLCDTIITVKNIGLSLLLIGHQSVKKKRKENILTYNLNDLSPFNFFT